jgi:hypothetical protein
VLVQYTYLHPISSAIEVAPPIPKQGDRVQVMGDERGAVYDGEIKAVAEPVFPSPGAKHVPYLLYVEVYDGQDRIHELVQHLAASGDVALRLVPS